MSAVVDPVVPSSESDAPPPPLVFTDSAANKVKELVDEEGNVGDAGVGKITAVG